MFFTDHDESIFSNGRQYTTQSGYVLSSTVKLNSDGIKNGLFFF